jgi:hypothetical protein
VWQYNYTSELYHHGVKGMRWGVRRFQRKDGSLTSAGKKRYSDVDQSKVPVSEKKKSKHRLALEESYRKHGLSQKDAEAAASKRIRTEKILAVSAGVTVAACAVYVAKKKRSERIDQVIKAGSNLQRIERQDTKGKLHDIFYTSHGKHDNARYEGMLGMTRIQQTGEAYLMQLQANKDIKVASKDRAAKVFEDLYRNDSDFRNSIRNNVSQHFSGRNKLNPDNMSSRNIRKMYENFNAGLIDIRQSGSGADAKFYGKLKSAGYGAIQDINDMKFSGYRAKNPLIVFGNSDNVMVKSVKELKDDDVMRKGLIEVGKSQIVEPFMQKAGFVSAAGLSIAAINTRASDPTEADVYKYRRNK